MKSRDIKYVFTQRLRQGKDVIQGQILNWFV